MNSIDTPGGTPPPSPEDVSRQAIRAQTEQIAELKSRLDEKTRDLEDAGNAIRKCEEKLVEAGILIKEGEDRYNYLLENAIIGVFIVQDGYIRFCNTAFAKMTTYSKEMLYARTFDHFLHPDDRQMVMNRHINRLQGKDEEDEYHIRILSQKGSTVWGFLKAMMTITWEGRPATLAFIDDLTETVAAESALRKSEERSHLFIEKMLNGFTYGRVILDDNEQPVDFEFLEVNEAFLRSIHLRREDIIGVPVSAIIPEVRTMQPDLIKLVGKVALLGENYFGEVYFETFGKWFEVSSYSIKKGKFNAIFKDVTANKQVEAASEESKAFLEHSLNSAPDGVLLMDIDFQYIFVNPVVTDMLGIHKDRMIGKTILELAPEYLAESTARWIHEGAVEQMRSGHQVTASETELKHRNGRMIPVSFSASAIRDRKDGVIGIVIFVKDITERKQTQELMIQTEKMMSVGGLAAGMAHEINNPLGGILQGTQNIIRRLSPSLEANLKDSRECGLDMDQLAAYIKKRKIDEMLAGIMSSGERAARIITNMLQFSRRSESNLCPNDINRLIDGVVELSSNEYDPVKKFDFRKIELVKEYGSKMPLVPCTKTEIEQVVLNLLNNAAHAMMETADLRTPKIVIRTSIKEENVCIEVLDNGPGLNPSIRNRIFEPFFTTKPVGTGTGLGLSVSYMIVTNNHKGTIQVFSEPGNGARFTIHLPIKQ